MAGISIEDDAKTGKSLCILAAAAAAAAIEFIGNTTRLGCPFVTSGNSLVWVGLSFVYRSLAYWL